MSLAIRNLTKQFTVNNESFIALKDISLTVQDGEFITIVGHSGCGKSTLLKIIAGLQSYESGQIINQGKPVTAPGPDRGMVFQDHRLMPWLTIAENVGFGLKGLPASEKDRLVMEHLQLVRLEQFAKAFPHQLSGGMAQRAAIARALVNNPRILLLDEPFGALDALTRIQMQREILRIWKQERTTMILVTHDIDEAIYLGQRTVVLSARPGEIKTIINVGAAQAKDRGSSEFCQIKQQILDHLFDDVLFQDVV